MPSAVHRLTRSCTVHCILVSALLTAAACAKPAPEVARDGILRAAFVLDGAPYHARLTVVDEDSTGNISEAVLSGSRVAIPIAGSATLTLDATLPPGASGRSIVFRDIIPNFSVPAGETLNVEFILPTAATRRPFAPTVLMRSAGTATTVTNTIKRDPSLAGRVSLTSIVAAPPRSSTILDGYYVGLDIPNGVDDPTARDFVCAGPCPHFFPQGIDCSFYCYACSTTVDDSGPFIRENTNLCNLTTPGGDPIALTSDFDLLAPGQGGVHLNLLSRLGRAIPPRRLELVPAGTSSGTILEPPNFTRRHPEFVTPAGDYRYRVTPTTRAGEPTSVIELPVQVRDGRITGLHITLPRPEGVAPRRPHVIADTRLGIVPRNINVTTGQGRLELVVSAEGPDPGDAWILLPLVKGATVQQVSIIGPNARPETLRPGVDYTVGEYAGFPSVTLRASGSRTTFAMSGPGVM
jgi:hypothetical protein